MNNRLSRLVSSSRRMLTLMTLALASLAAAGVAQASNPLGLYLGAAYGQAHIRNQLGGLASPEFDATHSAYQGMLGIRPLSFLGAEITYMDLGRQLRRLPYATADEGQKGEAAYALLYLPVPVVDVYVKAGLSRITTDGTVNYDLVGVATCTISNPNCGTLTVTTHSTNTSFAYGAGVQWKLGNWAVRGEYERFSAAGAHPTLLSIGMIYCIP